MKVSTLSNEVRVECFGMELLKLKTELSKRLGSKLRVEQAVLIFPLNSLPLVEDLFPEDQRPKEINDVLQKYEAHRVARRVALEALQNETVGDIPPSWLEKLDPAQAYAVSAMIVSDLLGLCLFDEQGSGKTVMTIAAFDILRNAGLVDAMIVICPKSMMSEWFKDISRFIPNKCKIVTAEGDRNKKYETALAEFDVLIVNYEGVDQVRIPLAATASKRRYLLVADESYYVKNSESVRSDAAHQLRDACVRCFVLCGTPAPNSSYDLVNQFDLADTGFTFAGFKKSKEEDLDRDVIATLIETQGTFIRRLKSQILENVPDKNFHVVSLPLKGRQALLYEKARLELELELRRLDNVSFKRQLVTYFQRRAVLLQICSNPSAIDPIITDTPVKYEYLDGLLKDLVGQRRKVILWSFYRRGIDELMSRYSQYNPIRIDGSIEGKERRLAVSLFQEDPTRMIFIGNPAAAGAGITLHAAYDAVYVSYSNQAAQYLQSLDRIHRRGQKSTEVNYYLLVCQGSIEETEVVRLRSKEIQQHSILGDNIEWPSSLDEALKELHGHS